MKDVMLSTRARAAVRLALDEDLADALDVRKSKWCDATSEALVDPKAVATGEIYAKGTGCVVAGATVAKAVMKAVDPKIKVVIVFLSKPCFLMEGFLFLLHSQFSENKSLTSLSAFVLCYHWHESWIILGLFFIDVNQE